MATFDYKAKKEYLERLKANSAARTHDIEPLETGRTVGKTEKGLKRHSLLPALEGPVQSKNRDSIRRVSLTPVTRLSVDKSHVLRERRSSNAPVELVLIKEQSQRRRTSVLKMVSTRRTTQNAPQFFKQRQSNVQK